MTASAPPLSPDMLARCWQSRAETVRQMIHRSKAAMQGAGLKDLSIHQIRHTVAVKMLQAGRPPLEMSQFPGHSIIQITERANTRFMPTRVAEAAENLDLSRLDEPPNPSQTASRATGNAKDFKGKDGG